MQQPDRRRKPGRREADRQPGRWLPHNLLLILIVLAAGCSLTGQHGTFEITGRKIENIRDFSGKDMLIRYTLEDETCPCNDVVFIQVARLTQSRHGRFIRRIFPSPDTAARRTTDGWFVDRRQGATQPWYGTDRTGAVEASGGKAGRNGQTAELSDLPGSASRRPLPVSTRFEFVTCAVCRKAPPESPCTNRVLDCLYWTFTIRPDGSIERESARLATASDKAPFKKAIARWNRQARGVPGQQRIPALQD